MHGSDPLDHDPAVENKTVQDLILAAGNRSDGRNQTERGAAVEHAGVRSPRRGFAGVERSSAPEAYLGRCLAVEHRRGMCSPLEGSDGRCGAGNGLLNGEGGSAATELAGARCLGA